MGEGKGVDLFKVLGIRFWVLVSGFENQSRSKDLVKFLVYYFLKYFSNLPLLLEFEQHQE